MNYTKNILNVSKELYKKALWSYFLYKRAGARVIEVIPTEQAPIGFFSGEDDSEKEFQKYDYISDPEDINYNPEKIYSNGGLKLLNDLSSSSNLSDEDKRKSLIFKEKLQSFLEIYNTILQAFAQYEANPKRSSLNIQKISNTFSQAYEKLTRDEYYTDAIDFRDWDENVHVVEAGRVIQDLYRAIQYKIFINITEESPEEEGTESAEEIIGEVPEGTFEEGTEEGTESPGQESGSGAEVVEEKLTQKSQTSLENLAANILASRKKAQIEYLKKLKTYRPLSPKESAALAALQKELAEKPFIRRQIKKKYRDLAEQEGYQFLMTDYYEANQKRLENKRKSEQEKKEKLLEAANTGDPQAIADYEAFKKQRSSYSKKYSNISEKAMKILKELEGFDPEKFEKTEESLPEKSRINSRILELENEINRLIDEDPNNEKNIKLIESLNNIKKIQQRNEARIIKEVITKQKRKNIQKGEVNYNGMFIIGYVETFQDRLGDERQEVKKRVLNVVRNIIAEKISDPNFIQNLSKLKSIKEKKQTTAKEKEFINIMKETISNTPEFKEYEEAIKQLLESTSIAQIKKSKKIVEIKSLIAIEKLKSIITKNIAEKNKDLIENIATKLNIDKNFSFERKIKDINEYINKQLILISSKSKEEQEEFSSIVELKEELKNKIKEETLKHDAINDIISHVESYKKYAEYLNSVEMLIPIENKVKQGEILSSDERRIVEIAIQTGKELLRKYSVQFGKTHFTETPTPGRETFYYKQNVSIDLLVQYLDRALLQGLLNNTSYLFSDDEINAAYRRQGYIKVRKK